jgi:hypothetical protein
MGQAAESLGSREAGLQRSAVEEGQDRGLTVSGEAGSLDDANIRATLTTIEKELQIMAEPDNNPQATEALRLSDAVDDSLNKAKAIIWLMTHQDTSEVVSEDAISWAGMVARELVDKAMAAVQANLDKARASV